MSTKHSPYRRRMMALADGGRVHPLGFIKGPGNGTSDSIQARLSNGEYVLPADTVRAVGVQKLDALRESTHTPVKDEHSKGARGFFAGGGAVEDQATAALKRARGFQVPGSAGAMAIERSIADRQDGMQVGDAILSAGRGVASLFGKPEQPEQALPAITNPTDARLAARTQRAPGGFVPTFKPPASAAVSAPQASSSAVTVRPMAQPPKAAAFDFDNFQPSPGQGAFRNEQTGEVTRLQDGQAPVGTRTWKEPSALPRSDVQPATQRQEVRAPVLNPNGGVFSSMVDFTNQAGQALQTIAANKGMRNDHKDALDQQRVGLDAASTLAKIDQGYQALGIDDRRAGVSERLAGVQADEFGLKREAAGFQNRTAKRMEKAQVDLESAKTPEEQRSARERLLALAGKSVHESARDRYLTVGGGQSVRDGQTVKDPTQVYDTQAQRWLQPPEQGAAPAVPSSKEALVRGQVYQTARGPARWDGGQFQPVR